MLLFSCSPKKRCRSSGESTLGRFNLDEIDKHHEWYVAWYAGLLVHEAKHGHVDSRKASSTTSTIW